jgi:ubiquinone/menaquinone biosynthesis C-methylase UbiE
MPDLEAIKSRQQQAWATGDYAMIGEFTVMVSDWLCEAVGIQTGHKVLDVATGSGNTALAAARRGGEVTGVDYVPALLERGRERVTAERLSVTFQVGDAESLPFPEATFDVVLSTFGVMFAPDQEKAAQELLRVCRGGGKIGLANWTPDGFSGENFRITGTYLSPLPDLKPPTRWGTSEGLQSLFGDRLSILHIRRRSALLQAPSAQQYMALTRTYLGPVIKVFESLPPEAQERLQRDLINNIRRFNQSGNATMHVPADYLEVVASKHY